MIDRALRGALHPEAHPQRGRSPDTLPGRTAGGGEGAEDLSAKLEDVGLDPARRTTTYCGGGYCGAFAAFVLHLMGFKNVAMYDGALEEWLSDPSNPLEGTWHE